MTKNDILQILDEHRLLLVEKFEVEKIGIFGSYANDSQNPDSDIDVYVIFKNKTVDNITGLWIYLEKLFGKKVDLVHYHKRLREGLKREIERSVVYG